MLRLATTAAAAEGEPRWFHRWMHRSSRTQVQKIISDNGTQKSRVVGPTPSSRRA
jgi:hypothetical protein